MKIKRANRFRFNPTPEQAATLSKTLGCARFGHNRMLDLRQMGCSARQERDGYSQTSTALKNDPEFAWLKALSSVPLQPALRHPDTALSNYFAKRTGHPVLHKRHRHHSAQGLLEGRQGPGTHRPYAV